MIFTLLLLFIAVFLGIAVFSGKGKLMSTDTVKKEKVAQYTKGLRIMYAVMLVVVLFMAFFNFVEKVAYTQTNYYEFTESYLGKDGNTYAAGVPHTTEEMIEILNPTESSGSLCGTTSTEELPYRYSETTYTLDERYAFLGFVPYQTAHVANFVCLGLSMAVIVVLFVFINKMSDKEAQKKKANTSKRDPVRPSMPKGAFDFSDYKDEVNVAADFADEPQDVPGKKK